MDIPRLRARTKPDLSPAYSKAAVAVYLHPPWLHPPPSRRAVVNNYHTTTVVAAPRVVSPFGFGSPFGMGGFFGFRPVVVMPFPFLGGLLQFLFLTLLLGFVFSVVKVRSEGTTAAEQMW